MMPQVPKPVPSQRGIREAESSLENDKGKQKAIPVSERIHNMLKSKQIKPIELDDTKLKRDIIKWCPDPVKQKAIKYLFTQLKS